MKKKKIHPIVYFSLLFVVLVSIQAYFLYNTVLLKRNEIKARAKGILEKVDVDYKFLEDTNWDESLYKWYEYPDKKISEASFIKSMKFVNDSLSPTLQKFVEQQYKETGLKLAFKKELKRVYDLKEDNEIISNPLVIYQTNPKPEENYLLSESNWESTYSASKTEDVENIDPKGGIKKFVSQNSERSYNITQAMYFDVLNLNQILFKELWSLFLVSIVLMILVLWLYFQSYKKYKEQHLQVLLLHDTIDNVAHEFKTPLATLKVASKQMRIIKKDETLDLMDRQIHRLEHLLKPLDEVEILDKKATEQQIHDFLQDYTVLYPEIHWNINIQSKDDFKMSSVEMETILGNLIENSIKYGGKVLDIKVMQLQDSLEIGVKDNGIGIAKEEQRKIFDKYYRVATNNIHNVKGLGLGLYLVQKTVQKHQGTIQMKSDLGKGCEITIEI